MTTGISPAYELGWAGKVREKALSAQGNNGEVKWKLGPLSFSTLLQGQQWGAEGSSQNPLSIAIELHLLRSKCLLAVRCAAPAGVTSCTSARAGDKGKSH